MGILLVVAVVFVTGSLRRPDVTEYAPTTRAPEEVGDRRVGPRTVTVDAADGDVWRYFDFSRGSVVEDPGPLEWDLAFRRFQVMANGGAGFGGRAGLISLGEVDFDSIGTVPPDGYTLTEAAGDSVNPAVERWYDYSWTSHLLTPKPVVYGVRTADGRYAKLRFVGYYCEGAVAGCVTFRYVYQGSGGTDLAGAGGDEDSPHHDASSPHDDAS